LDESKNATYNMVCLYDACDQISNFCHQQSLRKMRRKISWTTEGRTEVKQYTSSPFGEYIEYICSFFVAFFSATIDDRNLIFGHKLHIGTPYRGKRFWTHQIPTSCLPTLLIFIYIEHICSFFVTFFSGYKNQLSRQTGSRNLMGPKTLPTIWGTYMKLVTKYQISVFSVTVDGRNLIFGHKHHIGISYCG
jgi:hypothetical protein